jgi:dipeptidyl aminopeptidase/acylaminoacyl peptidase
MTRMTRITPMTRMTRTIASALLLILLLLPASAHTQHAARRDASRPALDAVLASAAALETFKSVAIAPDGRRLAWVEALPGAGGLPSSRSAIEVAALPAAGGAAGAAHTDTPAGAPRRVTAASGKTGSAVESNPVWSPDGRRLAFLSDAAAPGQLDLYVAEATAAGAMGRPRRLTRLSGQVDEPRWSPDGRSIALLLIEGRRETAGPLAAVPRDSGVVGETPQEQRLAVVDAGDGAVRRVSPADLYIYEYDWAPDGRSFAATAAHGSGDDNWYVAELYSIAADGTAPERSARSLWKPAVQIANPRVSPDGRSVAVIGGLMSDFGLNGGDVYVILFGASGGGTARDVTPGLRASPAWLAWTAADRLLAVETVDGETAVEALELPAAGAPAGAAARVTTVWRGAEMITERGAAPGLALAADGKTSAVLRQSFGRPPEVWAGPLGAWRQVTAKNARYAASWGEAKSLHWTSGGVEVQGWLLPPPGVSLAASPGSSPPTSPAPSGTSAAAGDGLGRRYPLVVVIHGGPASAHRAGWPTIAGLLASQGFLVLLPNPRGSYGAGEDFTRGNVKDFGYGDFDDVLAGLDAVRAAAPWNGRAGIFGWSYGGYMTMWAVTRTDRFQAAVAGAGVADWQSYYGQNRIDQWMIPYFGASVYDDPWIYARSSPISFIKQARTPTLVLQGERDAEVPAPQAYEFWHALKTLGVETQLVIYPDEGHRFAKPEDDRDRLRRMVEWFERFLRKAL